MREIKFRVWDNDGEIMDTSESVDELFSRVQEELKLPLELRTNRGIYLPFFKSNVYMQYTGLKDKNGVEIYEGDIVNAVYFKNKWIGKIIFNDNMACFELYVKHEDGHINSYLIGDMNSIEVIGNIYENPELLQN